VITLTLLHPLQSTPVQTWAFDHGESVVRIGRAADNQVVLYSAVVSRYHVELRQTANGWEVVNLGTNGTYISGKRVEQRTAEDGMVIRLARSGPMIQLRLNADEAAAPRSLSDVLKVMEQVGRSADQDLGLPDVDMDEFDVQEP
jgi:eukaryotic-like serine/threonine-protein kinase